MRTVVFRRALTAFAVTGLAVASLSIAPAAVQAAAPSGCVSPSKASSNPAKYVDAYITKLRLKGESLDQVTSDLHTHLCLTRLDKGGSLDRQATGRYHANSSTLSAISVTAPAIEYDNQAHSYYAIGYWKWTSDAWFHDYNACPNCNSAIGGTDGFAIAFSQPLNMLGFSATAFGSPGKTAAPVYAGSFQVSGPSTSNNTGAGYQFQDRGECRVDYNDSCDMQLNVNSGQEVASFKALSGCKTVQGFASYGHSWSSTHVSGFGLNTGGASISWSTNNNEWTRASQPGKAVSVCPH